MWKISDASDVDAQALERCPDNASPPALVPSAPRLHEDLKVLLKMFASEAPVIHFICSTKVAVALYGFGDALGSGFGASILLPNNSIYVRYSMRGSDIDRKSSNCCELCNVVGTLKAGMVSGNFLSNSELFLFTDNTTAEGVDHQGNCDNKYLFKLIVCLRCLDMSANIQIHLI